MRVSDLDLSPLNLSLSDMLAKDVHAGVWRHAETENGEFHWAYLYDENGTCVDIKKVREKKAWDNLPDDRKAEYNHDSTQYLLDTLEDYADETFRVAVEQCLEWCSEHLPFFTVDDVWAHLGSEFANLEKPHMIGPIIKRFAKHHLTFTGEWITYRTKKGNHATAARVWTGNEDFSRRDLDAYLATKRERAA